MEEMQIKDEKKENQGDRRFIQKGGYMQYCGYNTKMEGYTQCRYNAKLRRYMQYCGYTEVRRNQGITF
ncbi:MAG: hypothetical protein KAX30_09070 [Candidatus Atribacteria bacterium]|nr:hypothetical protein [Candidatus Atribacteria bacterium]